MGFHAGADVAGSVVAHGGDLAVQQGGVNQLPLAGFIAVVEGGYDGTEGQHTGEQVNEGKAHPLGGAVGFAGEVHQAAIRLDDEVVAGLAGHRPGASVAGDGAVDDVGVESPDVIVAQPEARQGAGAEAFNHHIGVGSQLFDYGEAVVGFEVDGEAALVAVEGKELGAFAVPDRGPFAGFVAVAGLLNFDDIGAHIGQVLGAEGAGEGAGEVDDLDVVQGLRHCSGPRLC